MAKNHIKAMLIMHWFANAKMLHKKFQDLYQDLDLDFILPTDFILMFDKNRKEHIEFFKRYNETINKEFN